MADRVITIRPDALVMEAFKTMRQHHIRRLPVVQDGKLVGLVTESHLRELGVKEGSASFRYYLVTKEKVSNIMAKNVITITPNTTIEECAVLANEHSIGTFPVIDNKRLVGIITTTDLFSILTQVLGFSRPGIRLRIMGDQEDKPLFEVPKLLCQYGARIQSMFPFVTHSGDRTDLILHVDTNEAQVILADLEAQGYTVEIKPH